MKIFNNITNKINLIHQINDEYKTKRIQPMNKSLSSESNLYIELNSLNNKGLNKMTKSQSDKQSAIFNASTIESHLINVINSLTEKISSLKLNSKSGRKDEVLAILINHGPISIINIANKIGISTKNVSSQLTYLRSDNVKICTDHNGLKFIIE